VYSNLDYQAATEQHPNPATLPTAHELVLSNPLRCTPIARRGGPQWAVKIALCERQVFDGREVIFDDCLMMVLILSCSADGQMTQAKNHRRSAARMD
jgi:hypothetical protein